MEEDENSKDLASLFNEPLNIISVGLQSFATELEQQQIKVTHLSWQPPANGDAELADLVSKLGG